MRLLLDTHILLWWLTDDPKLGAAAREAIADPANDVAVSVASLWEIVVKARIGKIEADIETIEAAIDDQGFERLGVARAHLTTLAGLPTHHRDPFDHLLIAQAIADDLLFVSDDRHVPLYPVQHMRGADAAASNA